MRVTTEKQRLHRIRIAVILLGLVSFLAVFTPIPLAQTTIELPIAEEG